MCNTSKTNHSHKIVLQAQTFSFCAAGQVLLAIAFHAKKPEHDGEGWRCYPSRATLAKLTGMVERSVLTQTDRLLESGLIKIIKQGKKGIANLYELNLELLFNPTADVFFALTNKTATEESQTIVKMSEERSEKGLTKFLKKIGINKKTYPQPTQKPIQNETGYTVKTSDQNDPTNNTRLKDLKREQRADSAIPSPEQNIPSKRTVEFLWECGKSAIKTIPSKIAALIAKKAPQNEIERLQSELKRQQDILEKHAPLAEYYGLSLA